MFLAFRGRQEHLIPTYGSKVMIVFVPSVQISDVIDLSSCLLNYDYDNGRFRVFTQLGYCRNFYNLSRMIKNALIGVVDQKL